MEVGGQNEIREGREQGIELARREGAKKLLENDWE